MKLGCNPEVRNRRNKTCAELITDASVWETLLSYVNRRSPLSPHLVEISLPDSIPLSSETKNENAVEPTAQVHSVLNDNECIVCCENPPTVHFEPCGHTVACFECAQRMKKCLECHVVIVSKSNSGK